MIDRINPQFSEISSYVTIHARRHPSYEAVVCGELRLTYSQLQGRIIACSMALIASGVNKGDRVACLSTPSIDFWVTFLASCRIGAIWLGLNPKYKYQEMAYVVGDAKPKLLFTIEGFEGRDYQDDVHRLCSEFSFIKQVVALGGDAAGALSYDDFIKAGAGVSAKDLESREAAVFNMDPALLVYTSGSTGRPKGALLSHYGLTFGAEVQWQHYKVSETRPRWQCSFPINHVACVADTCCVNLVAGGTIIFQERFDASAYLGAVEQENLTLLSGVPTMLLSILEHEDYEATDTSSIEMVAWGGAALPVPAIEKLKQITPRLMNVYGMTETAANVTYSDPDADIIQLSETIGRPDPNMPCRIINDAGDRCQTGEEGELQFKGDYLLLEYLGNPEATEAVYADGRWLKTGDVGYWREDGTISLVGRKSDMFKSGGYNVYPREIELLLESHAAVEMAAVIGVPDPRYQEVGAAFVKLSSRVILSSDELIAFCKANLANYKVPKFMRVISSLPMLPVGKVDKRALNFQHKDAIDQEG